MLTLSLLLMASAATAKNCATSGLLLTATSVITFIAAFWRAAERKGADWRFILLGIAVFFLGGILLIFGIVAGEVAHG
jgi:hypothetical protein